MTIPHPIIGAGCLLLRRFRTRVVVLQLLRGYGSRSVSWLVQRLFLRSGVTVGSELHLGGMVIARFFGGKFLVLEDGYQTQGFYQLNSCGFVAVTGSISLPEDTIG